MLTKGIMFLPDNCFDGINWRLIFLAGVQTAREGGRGAAGLPLPSSCYIGALATPYAVAMFGGHLAARSPRRGAHGLVTNSGPACLTLYKNGDFQLWVLNLKVVWAGPWAQGTAPRFLTKPASH